MNLPLACALTAFEIPPWAPDRAQTPRARTRSISNNSSLSVPGTYHVPHPGLNAVRPVLLIYSSAYFEVGDITITATHPILEIRKLRHGEVRLGNWLKVSPPASKWESWG